MSALPIATALARRHPPQEAELLRRRSHLAALRACLAERESALASLRTQLHGFEARYIRQVGVLYRQLDEWEQRIAELKVSCETPEERAAYARAASAKAGAGATSEAEAEAEVQPPAPDLRALFRELAKRIHPDFAHSAADASHRTQLMAQANDAYLRSDAALLHRMLDGHDLLHPTPTNLAAELLRVLTQIQLVSHDILTVDAELDTLAHSEMALLRERTLLAAASGHDLLAEMAARVKGGIGIAMRRYELDLARARRHQPAFDPTSLLSAEIP